jgi:hypothetical protein
MIINRMRAWSSLALAGVGYTTAVSAATEVRLIYQFPDGTFIENIALRPNGELVLNTFADGQIFTIDPTDEQPVPQLAAKIPEVTGVTGIAHIGPDIYLVSAGITDIPNMTFDDGSAQVNVIDLNQPCSGSNQTITLVRKVPEANILNGMTSLPGQPHLFLSVDSKTGDIYRINIETNDIDIAFQDDQLGLIENPPVPLGGNGIHASEGYLYFTQSARQYFGRIKIGPTGEKLGEVEVITKLISNSTAISVYDDFTRGPDGAFYVTQEPQSLIRITEDGQQTVLMDENSDVVANGTTCAVMSKDGTKVYVGTYTGQVVEVSLVS